MCVIVRIYNCAYVRVCIIMRRNTKTIISKFWIGVEMQELEEAKVKMVLFLFTYYTMGPPNFQVS